MGTVYADSLVALNAAADYLVLLAAGRLCALPLRRARMALGALWGGVYALLSVLWPGFFALLTVKLLAGAVMTLIAFGRGRRALRAVVAVYAVGAAFAGAVLAASQFAGRPPVPGRYLAVSPRVLLLSFALCYAAVSLVFRGLARRPERRLCTVALRVGARTAEFPALVDSGCELTDPVSGDPVLVADAAALAPLFPPGTPLGEAPLDALPRLSGRGARFRLIPCSSVGAESALLLCFRPDALAADGAARRMLVAVSRAPLAPDGAYRGVVPAE